MADKDFECKVANRAEKLSKDDAKFYLDFYSLLDCKRNRELFENGVIEVYLANCSSQILVIINTVTNRMDVIDTLAYLPSPAP